MGPALTHDGERPAPDAPHRGAPPHFDGAKIAHQPLGQAAGPGNNHGAAAQDGPLFEQQRPRTRGLTFRRGSEPTRPPSHHRDLDANLPHVMGAPIGRAPP